MVRMTLVWVAAALASEVQAQEEYRQVATFHNDRTADDRVFRLLPPEGDSPPEMKNRVLFIRNKKLECWSLPKPERAWETDLPCVPLDPKRYFAASYKGALLEASGEGTTFVDLRTGRRADLPLPQAAVDVLRDGRLLFSESGDAGMQIRVGPWAWDFAWKLERGWLYHDSRRIAVAESNSDRSKSRILIRQIGSDREPVEIQLPVPGFPQVALVDDRAYVTIVHPDINAGPAPAKPPSFAWAHFSVDAASGEIVDREIIPYSEACHRQGLRLGRHTPVEVKTASGIAGMGRLVVTPDRVSLLHRRPIWEKAFKHPQIVHRDEEMLAVRTEDRVFWLRTATGSVVFEYPLESLVSQTYHRIGPFIDVLGWKAKDPTPGVYSLVTGDRLVATPRKKDPEPGSYGVDFAGLASELSVDGDLAAVNVGAFGGPTPGEIGIFDLRTGKRRSTVQVGEPVTEVVLRGRVLATMSASGVRLYAP